MRDGKLRECVAQAVQQSSEAQTHSLIPEAMPQVWRGYPALLSPTRPPEVRVQVELIPDWLSDLWHSTLASLWTSLLEDRREALATSLAFTPMGFIKVWEESQLVFFTMMPATWENIRGGEGMMYLPCPEWDGDWGGRGRKKPETLPGAWPALWWQDS